MNFSFLVFQKYRNFIAYTINIDYCPVLFKGFYCPSIKCIIISLFFERQETAIVTIFTISRIVLPS